MSGGSGGSGGSGQGSHQAGLEEEQTAAVQEVEEGATMTLRLEKSPLTPWKKERGGRKKNFSPEGERSDRRRQMKVQNSNRLGVSWRENRISKSYVQLAVSNKFGLIFYRIFIN